MADIVEGGKADPDSLNNFCDHTSEKHTHTLNVPGGGCSVGYDGLYGSCSDITSDRYHKRHAYAHAHNIETLLLISSEIQMHYKIGQNLAFFDLLESLMRGEGHHTPKQHYVHACLPFRRPLGLLCFS